MSISATVSNEMRSKPGTSIVGPSAVTRGLDRSGPELSLCEIFDLLHGRLPANAMTSCLEQLPFIPMTVGSRAATTLGACED